jgi:hypothetical protein
MQAVLSDTKQCKRCGLVKDRTEFYFHSKYRTVDHRTGKCSPCRREEAAEFRHQQPERVKSWGQRWRAKKRAVNPTNVGPRQCAHCGEAFTPKRPNLCAQKFCCVDHRRRTNKNKQSTLTPEQRERKNLRNAGYRKRKTAMRRVSRPCHWCEKPFTPTRRADTQFCSPKCYNKHHARKPERKAYARDYQRKRRASGYTRKYEACRRKKLRPEDLERKRARLRAFYHNHKDSYRRRRKEWSKRPENRPKILAKRTRQRVRKLSSSQTELEIRLTLLALKRWCRANGYKGIKRFIAESRTA